MSIWVLDCTPLTCSFTLRSVWEVRSKSVCKQGVRGSSPLGTTGRTTGQPEVLFSFLEWSG